MFNNFTNQFIQLLKKAGLLILILLIMWSGVVYGQDHEFTITGTPKVVHFDKEDFHSDGQFWCMAEDDDGILYFGNNEGVLIYDGERWEVIKLPNGSTVRSLKFASDGKLYVGGFNEIGSLEKNVFGRYSFKSLNGLLRNEDRYFENVWNILEVNGQIVFHSFKTLIAIANNKAITLPSLDRYFYCTSIHNQLYVADEWGIRTLDLATKEFRELVKSEVYHDESVSGIVEGRHEDELLAFTREGNSYFFNASSGKSSFFKYHLSNKSSDQIFSVLKSRDQVYYLGTINSQILAFKFSEPNQTENYAINSLQDNTVLKLFETKEGNIWALLNKGLDCIEAASHVSVVFENAAVYDALFYQRQLLIATNQGVYTSNNISDQSSLSNNSFRLMEGMEAQAWSMWQYEEKAIICHDKGIFILDGNSYYHVEGTEGIWKVIPIVGKPHYYLACTYDGLLLIKYTKENKFVLQNRIEGFNISSRDILQSNKAGEFWVCHGYDGIFRFTIDHDFKRVVSQEHFTDQNGLSSPYHTNIFLWNKDTLFSTTTGIYHFETATNQFVPFQPLNEIIGEDQLIDKVVETGNKTWFVKNDELGFFNTQDETPVIIKDPFLSLSGSFINKMELIYPLGDSSVLVGTTDGLYHFDLGKGNFPMNVPTQIVSVRYKDPNDSIIFAPLEGTQTNILQLPPDLNYLHFQFAAPGFPGISDILFSYQLENLDLGWSEWSSISEKEYNYLKPGKYAFRVRSKSNSGGTSHEAVFYFEILPTWYQTNSAIILFVILGLVVFILSFILMRRKVSKTQREERELRRVLELEIEQIRLEHEKEKIMQDKLLLEEDVISKSKELTNYAMLLVKKRQLLTELHDQLKEIKESVKGAAIREELRNLNKKINLNLQNEEHLQIFDTNFERVHQEFFNELKSGFPDLTQKELRLCGFVKMNLSNKEIASILNISVRGVETARYRLRKRLSLSQDTNTVAFLEKLSSASNEILVDEDEG